MEFRNDTAHSRYVFEHDGAVAALTTYRDRHDRLFFQHTEVDPAHEGQGLASRLVRAALDDVRTQGRMIVPTCSYVRGWIERHPDYADLVDHELLAAHLNRIED